jgi:hypothetical protein
MSARALAQTPPKFLIADNSFLVEEAFNQDNGVVQNIFLMTRSRDGGWDASFTQEWPTPGQRHQFSYTMSLSRIAGQNGIGDALVNYRLQVLTEADGRPAFAPRVSAVLPTGVDRRSLGASGLGWQLNAPFSKRVGAVYFHWNVGGTFVPVVTAISADGHVWTKTPSLAASAIWAARPRLHLMIESYFAAEQATSGSRKTTIIISPGVRGGWNFDARQLVLGLAVPVTRGDEPDVALLGYVSYELPFRKIP